MVEYASQLDTLFDALSDPTRRDILARVAMHEHSVSELVAYYDVSFAAISKQLKVLESACLIRKRRDGRKQMISLAPSALMSAEAYFEPYRHMLGGRYDNISELPSGAY